MRAAHFIS